MIFQELDCLQDFITSSSKPWQLTDEYNVNVIFKSISKGFLKNRSVFVWFATWNMFLKGLDHCYAICGSIVKKILNLPCCVLSAFQRTRTWTSCENDSWFHNYCIEIRTVFNLICEVSWLQLICVLWIIFDFDGYRDPKSPLLPIDVLIVCHTLSNLFMTYCDTAIAPRMPKINDLDNLSDTFTGNILIWHLQFYQGSQKITQNSAPCFVIFWLPFFKNWWLCFQSLKRGWYQPRLEFVRLILKIYYT